MPILLSLVESHSKYNHRFKIQSQIKTVFFLIDKNGDFFFLTDGNSTNG